MALTVRQRNEVWLDEMLLIKEQGDLNRALARVNELFARIDVLEKSNADLRLCIQALGFKPVMLEKLYRKEGKKNV